MAYFADLSEYSYLAEPQSGVLNVGWLEKGQPIPMGETPEAFRAGLAELCDNKSIHHCMGHHVCEFCLDASWHDRYFNDMGNGEIWVRSADGIWYVAPRLIVHYVLKHDYCPPPEFVEAILTPSEIGIDQSLQTRPLSSEEEIQQTRAYERSQRELRGPPMSESDIDRIVQRGIRATSPRERWWRLW
jgi:hypothetical protein